MLGRGVGVVNRRRTLAQRMPEDWRWWIAFKVKHLRWSCWSDLVQWAIDADPDQGTLRQAARGARSCAVSADIARNGVCYCGKIRYPEFDRFCCGRPTRPPGSAPT